jgi:hypoxanthine phosphoribosyltransferase
VSISATGAFTRATESAASWLGPPLRTLRQPAFEAACAALMRLVEGDYAPHVIVGIRTGGLVVAEAMAASRVTPLPVLSLTCQRASTGAKTRLKLVRQTLAQLPQPMADVLRRLEHRWITSRRGSQDRPQTVDKDEAVAVADWLHAAPQPCRVLVADDAVDSGVTLATVVRTLHQLGPAAMELRTAAITQTLEHPRIVPDYLLYRGTLCRFPWSLDAAR